MDFTFLDYFNYYLKEFCNEIIANFPDFEKGVVSNYRELLETKQSKNDLYVKYFVSKVNDFMDDICNRNEELFVASRWFNAETQVQGGLYFLEGVDFVALWNSSHNNESNQKAIWKYLQLLVLLGRRVVPNREEVLEILNGVGGQVYAPAKVERTLNTNDDDLDDAGNKPDIFGLGNLAGLASLAGLGGGEMPDLSSIVKTLGDALGNIDMEEITRQMEEAQAEATESMSDNNETTESSDTTEDAQNNNAETTTDTSTETDNDESQSASSGEPNIADSGLSGGTQNLFTDLAKEMSQTFDFSDMDSDAPPANMGEAFSKFLSGNNTSKLMGLVGKFGSRLQQDIASGKVNQSDLLKDTTTMMSGLQGGNLKKQAKNMAKNNPAMAQQMANLQKQQQSRGGGTADRLRAKLAAKQAAKQNAQNN